MPRPPEALATFVRTDPLCRRLAALGEAAGTPLVLVGGCVRDWLLERPALDWDLIVPGDPAPLLAAAKKTLGRSAATLDESFGVYRLAVPDGPLIDFTRQQGDSLDADLRRRDLTINALAVSLDDGQLLDPTGGYADLAAGRVRAVSRQNLVDDPLRLVRVFRFAATLPGTVEARTLAWVRELAPAVRAAAVERIWTELGKLLGAANAPEVVAAMAEAQLLGHVLPEAPADAPARMAALARSLSVLDELGKGGHRARLELRQPLTGDRPRLAVLHVAAMLGADATALEAVAARLRWSKREAAWGRLLANARGAIEAIARAPEPRRARYRALKSGQDAIPGMVALALSWAPTDRERASELLADYWARVDAPLPRLVDGHDLQRELGIRPGPHLATLLAGVEEAQALGEVGDRTEALAWVAAHRE